jgi:hypothetical protein
VVGEEAAESDAEQKAEARCGGAPRPVHEERDERCSDVGEGVEGEMEEDPEGSNRQNEQSDYFEKHARSNGEPRHGKRDEITVFEVAVEWTHRVSGFAA